MLTVWVSRGRALACAGSHVKKSRLQYRVPNPRRVCCPCPLKKMSAAAGEQKPDSTLSGTKRPAVDGDGKPLSEKKLRRLEKNRLSARECRRRKREATENLASQINMLEGENLRLRLQLQVCTYLPSR